MANRDDVFQMVDSLTDTLTGEQLGDFTQILTLIYKGCTPVQIEAALALSEKKLLKSLPRQIWGVNVT